ncbi:MAG: putative oxidoreductase [Actinomycetota bacterium]|jgi:putative oxidoreductase|nr:putative oxidoreductase [Actinomycetota bacterium]
MDTGVLIIRVVVGLLLAGHGAQKLFGWFGGHGVAGTGHFMESLGFRPGKLNAALAGLGELLGGLFFAVGFLTPLAAAAMIAVMLNAIAAVHFANGVWLSDGGYEYNLVLITVAAGIAFTGPGAVSVDDKIGWHLLGVQWGIVAIVLGCLGAAVTLVARQRPAATGEDAGEKRDTQAA